MLLRSNVFALFFSMIAVIGALSPVAHAGMILTAEVYDTPGLAGFQTYDVTASSLEGFVNGFDFSASGSSTTGPLYGITGPLYQGGGEDIYAAALKDRLFDDGSGELADTRWLVASHTGLQIGASQSAESLHTAFTFLGTSTQRDTLRNLPFVRLVTNDPSAVRLKGEFLVNQFWSDGTSADRALHSVDTLLSDISVAPAPKIESFPDVPAEVIAERERAIAEEAGRQLRREQARLRQIEETRLQAERETLAKAQAKLAAEQLEAVRLAVEAKTAKKNPLQLEQEAFEAAETARLKAKRLKAEWQAAVEQVTLKTQEAERIRQTRLVAEEKTLQETWAGESIAEVGLQALEQPTLTLEVEELDITRELKIGEPIIDISERLIDQSEGEFITTDLWLGNLAGTVAIDPINVSHYSSLVTFDGDLGGLALATRFAGLQSESDVAVPEPSSILILGIVLLGALGRGRPGSYVG